MHNFKMLPAIVIPSLMLLSSVAFIIFAVQHTLPEEVSYFLKENSSFLPYLSLISVAVAFVVGAVIVRFISVFFKKIDQSDAYATILQYGSVELIRSLDDTYKVVIMLRLLYGSIPLFCVGLFKLDVFLDMVYGNHIIYCNSFIFSCLSKIKSNKRCFSRLERIKTVCQQQNLYFRYPAWLHHLAYSGFSETGRLKH